MSAIMELLGKLLEAGKGLPGLRRDEKRKAILREQLEEPHKKWCSLATLTGLIGGASEQRTKDLLISIGARGSRGAKKDMWGLKSRVDDPADQGQPDDEP